MGRRAAFLRRWVYSHRLGLLTATGTVWLMNSILYANTSALGASLLCALLALAHLPYAAALAEGLEGDHAE